MIDFYLEFTMTENIFKKFLILISFLSITVHASAPLTEATAAVETPSERAALTRSMPQADGVLEVLDTAVVAVSSAPAVIDIDGLMHHENKEYWSKHYAISIPHVVPSSFSTFVYANFIEGKGIKNITEFGCGDGRDSQFFSSNGLNVTATDYAESVITLNRERNAFGNLQYRVMDVSDTTAMNTLAPTDAYYARFFLHALPESARDQFIHWFGSVREDAIVFLEFRTEKDRIQDLSTSFSSTIKKTSHFRRFESLESVKRDFIAQNFTVMFEAESDGLSSVAGDNPVLARLVLKKVQL